MENIEQTLLIQADKLKKLPQNNKAITVLLNGIQRYPSFKFSSDFYSYLASLYLNDKKFLQAARFFAKALECYDGPTPPVNLFTVLEKDAKAANEDSLYLMYQLAMKPEIANQLRYRLFTLINRALFIGSKSKITTSNVAELYQKILNEIPIISLDINKPQHNRDVMILCPQFLSIHHGPTLTAMALAKNIREMGWNPILIALNSFDFDIKYSAGSFIANKYKHYQQHACFDFDKETATATAYPFSTVKYLSEEYPFFSIEMTFDDKLSKLPELLFDAIKNENVFICVGSPDIYSEILGRYTKVYMLPCHFGLPLTTTTYPIICRDLSESEVHLLANDTRYPNGLIESRFPYLLRFDYEHIDRSDLPGTLIFAVVGARLEVEVEEIMIQRMMLIQENYPSAIFKFIGSISQPDHFVDRLCNGGISRTNIILTGMSNNMRTSLDDVTFYLNPRRAGGGTSSLEVLSLAIPVITYPQGDVYHTCGDRFAFSDEQSMLDFINRYMNENTFRQEISSHCEERYHLNTNVKKVIAELTRGRIQ